MKIVGIVAEYNPFHKGHEYQLNKAREMSNCDGVAVVMSGNFVQRGEPAIIDKYKRAEAAIYGGADLVIELPMPFSCQNAEVFARAAISELKKLNITHLSFGCESDDLELLKEIALVQLNDDKLNYIIKDELCRGISYPTALTNAINLILDKNVNNVIKSPNNVLGIEYIKSSIKLNCNFIYVPIKRIGKNHNDNNITGQFDSATAIRKSLIMDFKNSNTNSLTEESIANINRFYDEYKSLNNINNYLNYIYYQILRLGLEGLNEIYEVSEGLNNKIYSNVFKYNEVDDFIMSLKSKRYTYSKLRRILLNILLGITKNDINKYMLTKTSEPVLENCGFNVNNDLLYSNNYIKVLAFNNKGRQILKEAKNYGTCIINKFSDYKKYNIEPDIFNLTNKSTDIYYLPFENRRINEEYLQNGLYVKA